MPIEWAGLGPEVLVRLDRELPESLRAQLERELREAIRSGRLQPGERLPSSRALARELGVSRGLVLECYTQLQAEGYLSGRTGSATRVAAGAHDAPPAPAVAGTASRARRSTSATAAPTSRASRAATGHGRCGRRAATVAAGELGYGDARGSAALREVLAGYLRRVRGAVADPERIVVATASRRASTSSCARSRSGVCGGSRSRIPAFRSIAPALRWPASSPSACRSTSDGIDVDALAASGVRAAVLTPAHQSPTGVLLAPERRHALIAWAREHDGFLIEDDYDAEFRYDREPVGALQGLAPDRVATLGTVSKSLAPALRLGWVLCPPRAHRRDRPAEEDRGPRLARCWTSWRSRR